MEQVPAQLEDIYDRFRQPLFVCALAVTRCSDMAEDAVQNAFTRMLRMRRVPENPKAYAFRSVRNAAIDLVRQRGRAHTVEVPGDLFDPSMDPRRFAQLAQFGDRVEAMLEAMSESQREAVVLHLYADLTFREIAEMRGESINTVKWRYREGLIKLRDQLEARSWTT